MNTPRQHHLLLQGDFETQFQARTFAERATLTLVLTVVASLFLMPGCAHFSMPRQPVEDITKPRQQRAQQLAETLDEKRDAAEFQSAVDRWNRNDLVGAEKTLCRLVDRNPDHRDSRLLLSELYLTTNRQQEAMSQMEAALAAHPQDAQVQYAMGLLLDAVGQPTAALAHYHQAAVLDPHYGSSAEMSSNASQATAAPGFSMADDSMVWANDDPNGHTVSPPDASRLVAAAYRDDSNQQASLASHPAFSEQSAGEAVCAPLAPSTTLLAEGYSALAEGATDTAVAFFQEAIASEPNNPQIPISAAVSLLRYNQPAQAVELLTSTQRQHPNSAALFRTLGVAHYRVSDYQSSQVALRQALSLDKSSALTYFLMGSTLTKLGQREAAEGYFLQAQTLNPEYSVQR